jgi:hypothetical protein
MWERQGALSSLLSFAKSRTLCLWASCGPVDCQAQRTRKAVFVDPPCSRLLLSVSMAKASKSMAKLEPTHGACEDYQQRIYEVP